MNDINSLDNIDIELLVKYFIAEVINTCGSKVIDEHIGNIEKKFAGFSAHNFELCRINILSNWKSFKDKRPVKSNQIRLTPEIRKTIMLTQLLG